MRTPSWETSPGALAALLNSGAPINKADTYTITLPGGTVLRYSGSDVALTYGGNTYALGPGISRARLRWVVGVEVSTLDITITDVVGTTINGQPLLAFIRARGLYGARVVLDRVFWGASNTGPVGALLYFPGRVAECDVDRAEARITVKSDLELLDVMIPRDLYQPGCLNTVYDALCGASRAAFTSTAAATGATDARRITFAHAMGQASGYFDQGVITMTSGPNAGQARTVKAHTPGAITVLQPWPFAVAAGDNFNVVAGCDKTWSVCRSKFSNGSRFRGMPYIPVAESIV